MGNDGHDPDAHVYANATVNATAQTAELLTAYRDHLENEDLGAEAKRAYSSRIGRFLAWLGERPRGTVDPLTDTNGRDHAVREYQSWLKTVRHAKPNTVNAHLTAIDHFYSWRGIGRPEIPRERVDAGAPTALTTDEQHRYLRAAGRADARDCAIGELLYYAGLGAEEVSRLDVDDLIGADRPGRVIVRGALGRPDREVPLHSRVQESLSTWLDLRAMIEGADLTGALFLNRRGSRLSDRSVRTIVADIAVAAELLHHEGERAGQPMVNPNTLRNTFAARLTDQGVDLGLIADLLGQATINPSRRPVHSSAVDRAAAIETHLLTTD